MTTTLAIPTRNGEVVGTFYSAENNNLLVILCHGLGSSASLLSNYGVDLSNNNYNVFTFDFIGGSDFSLSGGSMKEMTVKTEIAELNDVIDHFYSKNPQQKIIIGGESQGGYVAAMVSAQRNDITGLILLYQAFLIQDSAKELLKQYGSAPTFQLMGMTLGHQYLTDAVSIDPFQKIKNDQTPVLLIHGSLDRIVPISYAKRAAKLYPNCELVMVKAGHGIYGGRTQADVSQKIVEFLKRI
ncbi:phospholipase/carboxylesterase [Limosilactobacillus coleohominis 101-4-CHN]|uniref:Phospholipase/carboxylesterase n=1 Tax=Limosilactobacillus coleohominis 101-4-CHN TaxID=575594 RepID=C7XTW4_9LACO|nr:alpha/beta fold hydrolase [Limosilactobacillus coleohominis]EEU30725.1 phospholipase/carboxylesterase [Limosilactobacillus coleohominis 101-4-CHN]